MARQWHAEHRLYCPSVPACKHAAASVFGAAGEVSDAAGGTQALLVLGSLPYFFQSNRLFRLSRTAGVIVVSCVFVKHRISVPADPQLAGIRAR